MIRSLRPWSVLGAAVLALGAGAASGADLTQVYQDALAHDATFAAARATYQAGLERLPQGRAGLLPSVSLSGASNWNNLDLRYLDPNITRKYNGNSWQVQLSQPLFRWQNWVQYQQGEIQVAQAEAIYRQARQDVALKVAQAYFDVMVAQDALASARALKQANAEQLAQARKSFEVGTVTITDVHEAQSRHDLASAQEIAAESDLSVKRHALTVLTGKPVEPLRGLAPAARLIRPEPADLQAWVGAAEGANLGVQAAQLGYEVAVRDIERNRAAHLPTVDLVASYGNTVSSSAQYSGMATPARTNMDSAVIGVQLNLPLFQGGLVSSRTREAEAQKDKARADLESARRNAAQSARQAYLGVSSGLAQVQAYEAAKVSSRSALDANKLGYEVGVRINIDVLNAQSQLYDTEQKLSKARYETLLAQLRLKAAAGTLGDEDVQAVNALLE
jgi:outer membrane protein